VREEVFRIRVQDHKIIQASEYILSKHDGIKYRVYDT